MIEDDYDNYSKEALAINSTAGGMTQRRTYKEQLVIKSQQLIDELEKVNDAIEALDANPSVVDVLDKLSKVIRRL